MFAKVLSFGENNAQIILNQLLSNFEKSRNLEPKIYPTQPARTHLNKGHDSSGEKIVSPPGDKGHDSWGLKI